VAAIVRQTVAGPIYYVDATTGNDADSGSSSSPWRTIQKAANTVSGGTTVIVAPGTYNERVSVTRSGSSGSYIVDLVAPNRSTQAGLWQNGNAGLIIRNNNVHWSLGRGWVFYRGTPAGLKIFNKTFYNIGDYGVDTNSGSGEIRNNIFRFTQGRYGETYTMAERSTPRQCRNRHDQHDCNVQRLSHSFLLLKSNFFGERNPLGVDKAA